MSAHPLTVLATPIGNLEDLSPRAAEALRHADLIACENTRRTRVLTEHVGARAELVAFHQHNEAQQTERIIDRITDGSRVVLVSDAGAPAVSDPGSRLVHAAHAAGIAVISVPGPSAVTAAVAAAGFGGEGFAFVGFFPRSAGDLSRLLDDYDRLGVPLVGFESPRRVGSLFSALAEREPERRVVVCRELSKLYEETVAGTAAGLAPHFADGARGELTVVLAPTERTTDGPDLAPALRMLAAEGVGARTAAKVIAALGVAPRNAAYQAALQIAEGEQSEP